MAALQAAGLTLRVTVSREEFLNRSRILLDEMTEKMLDVVTAAGATPRDITVVLAVGGSTRMPAVRERMQDIFGVPPDTSVRPDEAGWACSNCGKGSLPNEKFCSRCGSPIQPPAPATAARAPAVRNPVCANCGKQLRSSDVFCGSCGTRRPDTP